MDNSRRELLLGRTISTGSEESPADSKFANSSAMAVSDPFDRRTISKKVTFGRAASKHMEVTRHTWTDMRAWLEASSAAIPLFLLSYSSCVSYAHLITSSAYQLPVRAAVVVSMHLFSCGLSGIFLPLKSKCPLIVSSADISVTIFYQHIVSDIVTAAASEGYLSSESVAATILLALPLNTVLMSLVFYVVGERRATVAVSYLPYPVVAGFLGSIGYAIFAGSFSVLKDGITPGVPGIIELYETRPYQLACAVTAAVGALFLKRCNIPARALAIAPGFTSLSLFWVVALLSGQSSSDLRNAGWLFQESSFEPFWTLWSEHHLQLVSPGLLAPRLGTFLGLGLVLTLSLTLRIAGIEGSTGAAMGTDEEVKATGLVNVGMGMCGAVIGSHSPGLTTFNLEAGSTTVHAAILTAVLQLLMWLSGFPVMNFLPRFLLAGILMNLGLIMLIEWMYVARKKVGYLGLLVIYSQVASSAVFGLLPSVCVGILVALLTAQWQLMQLHVLKYHVSRDSVRTNVTRSEEERNILCTRRDAIECIGLEGYLAEGAIIKFSNYVRQYVEYNRNVQYIIFDLNACQGSNVTACSLLAKLEKVLRKQGILAIFCNLEAAMQSTLSSFGVPGNNIINSNTSSNNSFLSALEHCENLLIQQNLKETTDTRSRKSSVITHGVTTSELQASVQKFLSLSDSQIESLCKVGTWSQKRKGVQLTGNSTGLEQVLHIAVPNYSEVTEMVDVGACHAAPLQLATTRFGALCGCGSVLFDEPARSRWTVTVEDSWILSIKKESFKELLASDPSLYPCFCRPATLQLLRHSDALRQMAKLNEGGGWRGGHFDRNTATACAKVFDAEGANTKSPEQQTTKLYGNFSVLSSPTGGRRLYKQIKRRSTIDNWASDWLSQRSGMSFEEQV
eukprot:TRINITY_DN29429_c0_g1_i1.p1 TRINITY_DN29429_c0_g1~~TRINITY_DN29429_c0_g1_i1.p1  ORF type:complete len:919 (+),score=86.70 TRINITY_DN29429_c0_g1_i1:49-2757(+)